MVRASDLFTILQDCKTFVTRFRVGNENQIFHLSSRMGFCLSIVNLINEVLFDLQYFAVLALILLGVASYV